jgi:hypothetical protein
METLARAIRGPVTAPAKPLGTQATASAATSNVALGILVSDLTSLLEGRALITPELQEPALVRLRELLSRPWTPLRLPHMRSLRPATVAA